jgi:hypothetical protein
MQRSRGRRKWILSAALLRTLGPTRNRDRLVHRIARQTTVIVASRRSCDGSSLRLQSNTNEVRPGGTDLRPILRLSILACFVPLMGLSACSDGSGHPSAVPTNSSGAPTITTQPTNQTVTAPAAATFIVSANGTPP